MHCDWFWQTNKGNFKRIVFVFVLKLSVQCADTTGPWGHWRESSGGSRGGARGARPPYFYTKMRPEGPKKNFETAPPPLSQGLDDRPTPSPIIWRSRFATGKGVPISEVADIKAKNANIAFFSYSFPSLMWFSTLSGAKKLFYGPFLLQGSFANNRLDILSFQDSTSKQRLQEYFFYLNVLSFH